MKVFVDTGALLALSNPRDDLHERARDILARVAERARLVTTAHVVDEAITLVRRRVHHARAVELGQSLLESARFDVVFPGADATAQAMTLFSKYADLPLSFTDCTSFVVMRAVGLTHAFTFDEHFRIMGFEICG